MADSGLRALDLRFLLPELPGSVRLVGEPSGWREGLATAGIPIVDGDAPLTVAAGRVAGAIGSPNVIVLGARGARALRRAGYATRVVLVRPHVFVPLDARSACAHVLFARHPRRSAPKRLAARGAVAALRLGIPVGPAAIVATRREARPLLLATAEETKAPTTDDWCVLRGGGDDLQRLVCLCFAGPSPRTAVKWTRVPGNAGPFERDAAAGATLGLLPESVRGHAVHHYGRFQIGELAGVAESAAPGIPLQDVLEAGGDEHGVIDAVAHWIVELGAASRDDDGVFQHTDLGTWNVLVDGAQFTVVDWESSRRGEPLWDLAYFLSDALTARGARDPAARVQAILALHRGESPESERFFDWIDRAAQAAGVEAVGEVLLRCWQHHARSHGKRADRGRTLRGATAAADDRGPLERLAEPWQDDPELGAGWPVFARRRGSS